MRTCYTKTSWGSWIGVVVSLCLMTSVSYAQETLVIAQTDGGEWLGQIIAFRVLQHAYQQLGIQMAVKDYPAERSVVSANEGIADGVLVRMGGLEATYPNLVQVSVPITYLEMMVFTKEVDFPVTGWDSLKPYTINYMRGNKLAEQHTAEMTVETVTTPEQAFKKLAAGRTDVVLEVRDLWCMAQSEETPGIRLLEPPLERIPTYHYLHKRHEALIPRLEEILTQMETDTTIKRITDEATEEFMSSCGNE